MYHEEKIIDGVLHWRSEPDGEFKAYTTEQLSSRVQSQKSRIAVLESHVVDISPADARELVRRADQFYTEVLPQLGKVALQDYGNLNELGMLLDRLKREAETLEPFTVISTDDGTDIGQIMVDHVQARNGLHAFTVAAVTAADRPTTNFVVALPGHHLETTGCLTFPGEGVVDAGTVLEQPEVFR